MAGSAVSAAEARKHATNDAKCNRLFWVCIPLAMETSGCWGVEAIKCPDRLAARIATRTARPKSSAVSVGLQFIDVFCLNLISCIN